MSDSAPVTSGADPEPPSPVPSSLLAGLVRTARPKQWMKNVLVVAAPAAAGVLGHGEVIFDTIIAFVAFCLAASGTYFLNDSFDVEADRRHEKKRLPADRRRRGARPDRRVVGVLLLAPASASRFSPTGTSRSSSRPTSC